MNSLPYSLVLTLFSVSGILLVQSTSVPPTPRIITTTVRTVTTLKSVQKLPRVIVNGTWECGTDEFTKAISEGEVSAKCPKLRDHINSCCFSHDQCYDDQKGQQFCDDSFCDCLERRSRSSTSCHTETSPLFCDLVRTFGDDAYKASAPNATTTDDGLVEKDDYDYEAQIKNSTRLVL